MHCTVFMHTKDYYKYIYISISIDFIVYYTYNDIVETHCCVIRERKRFLSNSCNIDGMQ